MGLKRLITGFVLLFIALVMLFTSGNKIFPYIAAVIGLVGVILFINGLMKTGLRSKESHGRNRARRIR